MKKYAAHILTIACIFMAFSMFSCYKGEQFLGQTEFTSTIQIEAFSNNDSATVDVTIDDTTWSNIHVGKTSGLKKILETAPFKIPEGGKSHIKIVWNDNLTIVDEDITLKSKNNFYILQLDEDLPPAFLTSFGEASATPPDAGFVKARFYYQVPEEDTTSPWPDTVRIEFTKLVQPPGGGPTTEYPDTSLVLVQGQVSSYIQLPHSKGSIQDPIVSLGYRIVDPKNNTILQDFCYSAIDFGIIELDPDLTGANANLFQTLHFNYIASDPGVPGCNFDVIEMYQLAPLF